MKKLIAMCMLALAGAANAQTVTNFDTPEYCANYCANYQSDGAVISFVNITPFSTTSQTLNVTINIDDVYYSGQGEPVKLTNTNPYIATLDNVVVTAADGSQATVSVVVLISSRRVNSGRAHYTLWKRYAQSGTVTTP